MIQSDIMVVDDNPANLKKLLEDMLLQQKADGKCAPFRSVAWRWRKLLRKAAPNLILLDINMPGMNGYEVCQRLEVQPGSGGHPGTDLSERSQRGSGQSGGISGRRRGLHIETISIRGGPGSG